jgi:hypothetical protein
VIILHNDLKATHRYYMTDFLPTPSKGNTLPFTCQKAIPYFKDGQHGFDVYDPTPLQGEVYVSEYGTTFINLKGNGDLLEVVSPEDQAAYFQATMNYLLGDGRTR